MDLNETIPVEIKTENRGIAGVICIKAQVVSYLHLIENYTFAVSLNHKRDNGVTAVVVDLTNTSYLL